MNERAPSWFTGWRGALLCGGCVLALLGAIELGLQLRWRSNLRATSYDPEYYANGRLARVREEEARWLGGVLELWFLPDGTVDRERSYRARFGVRRAIPEAELRAIETNDWWSEVDATTIAFAIARHAKAHGSLPERLEELGPMRKPLPPDRWGRAYVYAPPANGAAARIVSFGKDGVPGGVGDDADWSGELAPNGDALFADPLSLVEP